MATDNNERNDFLNEIKRRVHANVGDEEWEDDNWTEFIEDVAWWLHAEKGHNDHHTINAAAGLVRFGVTEQTHLGGVAGTVLEFRNSLSAYGVSPVICNLLFNKYVLPHQTWTLQELMALNIRSEPQNATLTTFIAREAAINKFDKFRSRRPIEDHGHFSVFVASGHVRSGKTRLGKELGKHLADALYVQVNLGNGYGYSPSFDGEYESSLRLGGRLVRAYFETEDLRPFAAFEVLDYIFALGQNSGKNTIVVHFDEHGQYVRAAAADANVGVTNSKVRFTAFLDSLNAYATSRAKVIIPVVSGTTYADVSVDHDSHYVTRRLPLAPLNLEQSLQVAADRLHKTCADRTRVVQILDNTFFKVAIADSGGLPGAVIWACDSAIEDTTFRQSSFIEGLYETTRGYGKFPSLERWKACVLCSFARPPLIEGSILIPDNETSTAWTVSNASDSGSILVIDGRDEDSREIRVAPCFLAACSLDLPYNKSILLANLTPSDPWTWQRFEQAHAHYFASVLYSIHKTKGYWEKVHRNILMKDVIRGAQPEANEFLQLIFEPEPNFTYWSVTHETKQSIPRCNAAATEHLVDMANVTSVHLSCPGTPIIDGHVNLNTRSSAGEAVRGVTLFVQYKHSVCLAANEAVKVSVMNQEVANLAARLSRHSWPTARQWALLWVTNRSVILDETPHTQLLWVGREQLWEHAPLIGMRGLVAMEGVREGE